MNRDSLPSPQLRYIVPDYERIEETHTILLRRLGIYIRED